MFRGNASTVGREELAQQVGYASAVGRERLLIQVLRLQDADVQVAVADVSEPHDFVRRVFARKQSLGIVQEVMPPPPVVMTLLPLKLRVANLPNVPVWRLPT